MSAAWAAVCVALALALVLLSACGSGPGKGTAGTPGPAITVNVGTMPRTLDPAAAADAASLFVADQVFEMLTRPAPGGVEPAAAASWEVLEGGRVYVFHLRAGFWSDGRPVVASDFQRGWDRARARGGPYADLLEVVRATSVPEERTLRVELVRPDPSFPARVSLPVFAPLPPAVPPEAPSAWREAPDKAVVNGPFRPVAAPPPAGLQLVRNDRYPDSAGVALQTVRIVAERDAAAALALFRKGAVDLALDGLVPPSDLQHLLEEGVAGRAPLAAGEYVVLHTGQAPFGDVRVRLALALAVDRRAVAADVLRGLGVPALGVVPWALPSPSPGVDFRGEGGVLLRDGDLVQARQLLAAAGYPGGRGFPAFVYLYPADPLQEAVAQAVARQWRERLGIPVEPVGKPFPAYREALETGAFGAARVGLTAEYADPLPVLLRFSGGALAGGWRDVRYEAILGAAAATGEPRLRAEGLHAAELYLVNQMPAIPLFFYVQTWLQTPDLIGVYRDPVGGVHLRHAHTGRR
ncbi:MAG: peptide ABC transporter substrate-binding protein [Clostridia bacterium]|nr:peptide ABC transporter substrate-binding protein [Clostridia bacterium]